MSPGYSVRDSYPTQLPTKPPYTAHLGNLSYEATEDSITALFEGCDIVNVRIIEDKIEQRPKGFAYAEFAHVDGLKQALTLDGTPFEGRTMRVKIADPRKPGPIIFLACTSPTNLFYSQRARRWSWRYGSRACQLGAQGSLG